MRKILAALAALLVGGVLVGGVAKPAHADPTTNVARCAKSNYIGPGKRLEYFTGFSYWDNTPPGSSQIAFPKSDGWKTVHNVAAGAGTYSHPITMAVGWCLINGHEYPDYVPGTRFYIPYFKRYFIVEDECGDGKSPQTRPCHVSERRPWQYHQFDLWVKGRKSGRAAADRYMDKITGLHYVIEYPPSNLPVPKTGPLLP